jgi:asparagine synthase (glutamine-hydrolysing)
MGMRELPAARLGSTGRSLMCGIAGVWSEVAVADRLRGERLAAALSHRGPDGGGVSIEDYGRLLLAHRRLAIVDLSARANQPMRSADGRHVVVFNGEIYNHRSLRQMLEAEGVEFFSDSDTEVLLMLLARRGPDALALLRGMFACAWWDEQERTLLIARDRFGIKPLYYHRSRERLAFASEIGALVSTGLVERRASESGVLAFLRWGSVPAPLTWIAGVRALEPGRWRRWRVSGAEDEGQFADARTLWTERTQDQAADDDAFSATTREALSDTVAAHLVADVPVGAFLSGGLDSAALVATAARLGSATLHTYTVSFDDESTSEHDAAARTAEAVGTTHHRLHLEGANVAHDFPTLLERLDAPTIDGVNTYYVSKAVAATGVKAVLSGLGGDELFAGYPSFRRFTRAVALQQAAPPLLTAGAFLLSRRQRPTSARWAHVAHTSGEHGELYRALRGYLMPHEIDAAAGERLRDNRAAAEQVQAVDCERLAPAGRESALASIARLETVGYMATQLLRDTDVASMAHGLEVRVPFVDHVLIGAVWPRLARHQRLAQRKRLLARAVAGAVPDEVQSRAKRGFILPFDRWMRRDLQPIVREGLQSLEQGNWIRPHASEEILAAWRAGRAHWTRPWGLAVLGWMLRGAN